MNLPLHPATVHFPIAFLSISYGLDVLQPLYSSLPSLVTDHLPAHTELARLSYYALSLGLLTALPAISSGIAQAVQIVGKQGLFESDGKTIKPKMKALGMHAVVNDVVVASSAWLWWGRSANDPVDSGNVSRAGAALVLGLLLVWTGHLGGKLTYENGMGMSFGSKGKGKSS